MGTGMRNIRPPASNRYLSSSEPYLYTKSFMGLDLDGEHISVPPGYFRDLNNLDIFPNYMRTRQGWKVSNAENNYSGKVTNGVVWDIGTDDIAIFCLKDTAGDSLTRFYYKNLTTLGAFDKVYIKGTGSGEQLELDLSDSEPPDMFVLNDRVYIFTVLGNYILEYNEGDSNLFTTRTMGLPSITANGYSLSAGTMTGEYQIGVELVFQRSGIDSVASSPNRVITDSTELFKITTNAQKITLDIESSSLPSGGGGDDYWTHVRVYQSRRLDRDISDPANPLGPFGIDSELYPVVLISRADLEAASYNIDIDVDDSMMDLTEVWEIDRIELTELPSAYCGTVHKGRIYVSPGEGAILYYSNFAGTKYSEQGDPLQNIPVNAGDGKKIRKLLSLNNDLVIFKETSTFISQNGNVDLPPTIIDKSIGLSTHRAANYIPKLGLVAITSDNFDLKIFTDQLVWTNLFGKLEISRQIRPKIRSYYQNINQVSILYINGKLIIASGGIDGVAEMIVLAVEQSRGWSTYTFPLSTCQFCFVYNNGSQAGIISGDQVQSEFELSGIYIDSTDTEIDITMDTHMYQSNHGQDLLEMHKIILTGTVEDTPLLGTMYVNGIAWESIANTPFFPDPSSLTSIQKSGNFELWPSKRPVFPFMYLHLTTSGDLRIDSMKWVGIINTDMTLNYLNRLQTSGVPVITQQPSDVTVGP